MHYHQCNYTIYYGLSNKMLNETTVIKTVLQEAVIYLDGRHVTFKNQDTKERVNRYAKETKTTDLQG